MKYLVTILVLFIWIVCFSSSQTLQKIYLDKYCIVRSEIKRNKVSKVKMFGKASNKPFWVLTYDSIGRIQSKSYPNNKFLIYTYQKSKDTLTRNEFESNGQQEKRLIRIEKFIYNQYNVVNEYYSLHEERTLIYGKDMYYYDTVVFVERELIEYNGNFQILKVKHFTKSISNLDILNVPYFPFDSLKFTSIDSVIYDAKGRITAKYNIDSNKEIRVCNKTKFDKKARLIYDNTTWYNILYIFGKGSSDMYIKRIYSYENDKSICIEIRGDSKNGRKEQRKLIETTYYDERGMESMLITSRVNAKTGDTLVFEYEYYN